MKQIRKDVREYIIGEVNETLSRLGINSLLSETGEYKNVCFNELCYSLESSPVKQTPVLFKMLRVVGNMASIEVDARHPLQTASSQRDIIRVSLDWSYTLFSGGHNGHTLGSMVFLVDKNLPEKFVECDDMSRHVWKYESLKI